MIKEKLLSQGKTIDTYLIEENGNPPYIKKVLSGEFGWEEIKQLENEGKALLNIDHPKIPKLKEYSLKDKEIYLVREYKPGKSLQELLKQGKVFSQEEVVGVGLEVLDILAYLHEKGIVHRDIKPTNLIWDPETKEISLVDLGIAKLRYFSGITDTTISGSFPYMAPEQYFGKSYPSSDIHALGATLIELLTGKTLDCYIKGESISERKVVLPETIGKELNQILTKMTETDCKKRYQSAKEAASALEAWKEWKNGKKVMVANSNLVEKIPFKEDEGKKDSVIDLKELAKEAFRLMKEKKEGFTQIVPLEETLHNLGEKMGYKFIRETDGFKIRAREKENTLKLLIQKDLEIYYVHLKKKNYFDKFLHHIHLYLLGKDESRCYFTPEGEEIWEKQKYPLPEIFKIIYKWNDKLYETNDNKFYSLCFSFLIITIPWVIYYWKKYNKIKNNPPEFTEEEIEKLKPYFGEVLKGSEAIKALCQDFAEERKL